MKKELFETYKEVIIRCINSCITESQLIICYDIIQRFRESFFKIIVWDDLRKAVDEIEQLYLQKQNELNIF